MRRGFWGGSRTRPFLWGAFLLALLTAACGGLGGEPNIVATAPPPTEAPQDVGYPVEPPDLARGAEIFAQHCTECHGDAGQGNGELVIAGQVPRSRDFTDPATTRDQRPTDWFGIITNGRMERLMPPWGAALSEEERWAVALYTYTLPYTQAQLEEGQQLYLTECAECHGESGQGDGERADELSRPLGDFTDQLEMALLPDSALFTIVSEGQGEQMPAYADELTEEQRWAVVAYTHSLSLANTDVIGEAAALATAEATPAVMMETAISGQVTNGTAGASVPADLPVTLYVFTETAAGIDTGEFDTTIDAEGRFSFADVPIIPDSRYVVSTAYRERVFTSEIVSGTALAETLTLPVTIYELTEDPSVIRITAVNMRVDATSSGLQILQEVLFENTSDRLYTNSLQLAANTYASVVVGLPPGAVGMAFSNPNRFVLSEEQQVIVDTLPVQPGADHAVQFSYFLPYEDGAVIEQPVYYTAEGTARLMIYPDTLTIESAQFAPVDPQTIENRTYDAYEATLALSPGDVVRFDLSGQPAAPGSAEAAAPNNAPSLLVIGLILEVLVIGGLLYLYLRRKRRAPAVQNTQLLVDGLIRQIAELDNQREAGRIDEDTYQNQRARLKARLAELMEKE